MLQWHHLACVLFSHSFERMWWFFFFSDIGPQETGLIGWRSRQCSWDSQPAKPLNYLELLVSETLVILKKDSRQEKKKEAKASSADFCFSAIFSRPLLIPTVDLSSAQVFRAAHVALQQCCKRGVAGKHTAKISSFIQTHFPALLLLSPDSRHTSALCAWLHNSPPCSTLKKFFSQQHACCSYQIGGEMCVCFNALDRCLKHIICLTLAQRALAFRGGYCKMN